MILAATAAVVVLAAGCASFSAASSPTFTAQPTLTEIEPTAVTPEILPPSTSSAPSSSPSSSRPSSVPSSSAQTSPDPTSPSSDDPCAPTDSNVVATCLSAPWGLVPLDDGVSALVGERTTGRVLQVSMNTTPVLVATVPGIDAKGGGGLLGLAVSPSYDEDGLIYAYVTTATDNRIEVLANGDQPKPIFTGIPKGAKDNGGAIGFLGESLYVATGDTGDPAAASSPTSLAGKVLRLNEYGKPAAGNPQPGSAIFASGLTQATGICLLPTGAMGVIDRRAAADLLLAIAPGKNYSTIVSGDAAWTWTAADGGVPDCAYGDGVLANTSLNKMSLTTMKMSAAGTFSGSPNVVVSKTYGRLLSVAAGSKDLLWITTSNKDGHGKPVPSDDRVIVLHSGGGGAGEGPD